MVNIPPEKFAATVRRFVSSIGIALTIAAMTSSCTRSAPEQAIREAIGRIEAGIEERDAGDVVDELAEYFKGNGYLDRKDVHRLLVAQFLQHQKIHVLLTNVVIEVSEPDQMRANMTATVVATGATGLIPDDGRLWRLDADWELVGSDWQLARLSWK